MSGNRSRKTSTRPQPRAGAGGRPAPAGSRGWRRGRPRGPTRRSSVGAMLKSPHTATACVGSTRWHRGGRRGARASPACSGSGRRRGSGRWARTTLITRTPPHVAVTSRASASSGSAVGESRDHVVETDPAQDGHAVPPTLAVVHRLVAQRGEGHRGEGAVGQLRLLQADDVGLAVGQPLLDPLPASVERVHVPGHEAHAVTLPVTRRGPDTDGTASPEGPIRPGGAGRHLRSEEQR